MTKTLILLCLIAPLAITAGEQARAKTRKPASQTGARPQEKSSETVPADAVQTGPGAWEWTAPDGKVWNYRQTPFGLRRTPGQTQAAPDAETAKPSPVFTAREEGDMVRFERLTPFGKRTWTRKKDEMDETERLVWERDCNKHEKQPGAGEEARPAAGEKNHR